MGVLIQVKNVPEDVHRTLKARAALEGVSLSEYIRQRLEADATRPTPAELEARIRARGRARPATPSATLIRELRDAGG